MTMLGLDRWVHDEIAVRGVGGRRVLLAAASLLFAFWLTYRLIWGFGGFYTHVRYIPTPDNLIRDEATSLIDIDAERGQRHYWAELTVDELIAFNQQALPEMGWRIIAQGESPPELSPYYCIIAEQKGVRAYIKIGQGATTDISAAFISINVPNSLCVHLLKGR